MTKQFSVADARKNLPHILDRAEKGDSVELTRRGKPIAVIMPIEKYRKITKPSFWEAVLEFRQELESSGENLEGVFDAVRDRSSGREVDL